MPHSFFWYDIMTTDTKAAEKFYAGVVGWKPQDSGSPGYTSLTVDGMGVAGLMAVPQDAAAMGARPAWMGYILVDDVAAMAAASCLYVQMPLLSTTASWSGDCSAHGPTT